ncbi:unnamed protein product [Ranitomeya imitator]|uniref:Transmembrane protein 198 n=1 Tax=Ranitomeya imitator TaxID=111125 RepID=A0ABN9LBL6_9NEOB|nr:unnamed protein product [Ranitomeya imitator]
MEAADAFLRRIRCPIVRTGDKSLYGTHYFNAEKALRSAPGFPGSLIREMTAAMQAFHFKQFGDEPGQDWPPPCEQEIERRYQVVPSVVCAMCCLFGIIYCFFGYRCFKAVMFLTGLMFGSVVIFMLCYKERVLDTQLSVEASVGIGLGIGVLCGLVTMLYVYQRMKVDPPQPVCWYSWVILGIWPVLSLLGVLVQWKVTAEGYSHTEGYVSTCCIVCALDGAETPLQPKRCPLLYTR